MIDELEARNRVEQFLKCPSDDPNRPWSMEGFGAGWLVRQGPLAGFRGQASYVVERETGRIVSFPSSIPPRRIREEYDAVVARGKQERSGA
jgi:hypothetical protein